MISKKFVITTASVFAAMIVAAVVAILVFVDPWIESQIKDRLRSLEKDSLTITYKDLDIDLLSGSMILKDGSVEQHTDGQSNFRITVEKVNVSGFDIISYVFSNKIVLDRLEIDSPNIRYTLATRADSVANSHSGVQLPKIMIELIQLKDGVFSIVEVKDSVSAIVAEGKFKVTAGDLATDSTATRNYKYFDLQSLNIQASDVNYVMADSLHNMHIKSISYNLNEEAIRVDSLHIRSLYKKYELARVAGHELDWMDIYNPAVTVTGMRLASIAGGFYDIDNITIEGFDAVLFRDKRLPFPDKPDTKLLHQALADIPSPISINTIELKKANVEYQEHVAEGGEPGNVTFNNLYATFYNFTNVDSIAKSVKYTAHMDAQCNIMGNSLLKASFSFPLIASEQPYTVSGSLQEMDLTAFNPMLERVAFTSIEKGRLVDLDFDFHYNTEQANGKMNFSYEDLKINTISKATNSSKGAGQDIKSFIANLLILKKNNLKDKDDFRVGDIDFARHKKKSIFNYWWKSLLTGFRSSTGLSAPKQTDEED
ncbi:hypothetical protein C900_05332 [Fulvivirga imtechensis AK7]|uniref:DUF748 domain-containing protein n=1 Tax=Fulvivirga imtechensis AK7 TaxID=1237149 RepID=L8JK48_9BACT|nr:DUF748 domain-containing protein [Fulvivirga imtechensis]ELR69261.1 hypothetical protein C900_05332 [Fulvivirga imtechensis AK7]